MLFQDLPNGAFAVQYPPERLGPFERGSARDSIETTVNSGDMMKATSALFFALGFVCLVALAADKPAMPEKKASPLVGTWEMVSEKWNDAKEFTPPPPERKALKFITPTHFIWIHVDPKTKKISNSMGGSYRHDGDSYTETIEFVFEGLEAYLGKDQKFTAKIEGDKWTNSGVLSEGQKLEEIWKRVK